MDMVTVGDVLLVHNVSVNTLCAETASQQLTIAITEVTGHTTSDKGQ